MFPWLALAARAWTPSRFHDESQIPRQKDSTLKLSMEDPLGRSTDGRRSAERGRRTGGGIILFGNLSGVLTFLNLAFLAQRAQRDREPTPPLLQAKLG